LRGLVEEQKQLAREFSGDVAQKTQVVKQILEQGLKRNEELYEHQRLLTRELETVSLELKRIQRQIEVVDGMMQPGDISTQEKRGDTVQFHGMEPTPEAPGNPDKARNAFRQLLECGEKEDKSEVFLSAAEEKEPSSLQRQVVSYNAAGMSVLEISEKLNLSKGEVRLILSLKDKQ
ncbi:MAG: hypothetical protein KAH38_12410, partial [Candidatus Hydrogenedentes bacterium]|nr:hypothetical protein [Candidatus Hydrogenedentota bacterium]